MEAVASIDEAIALVGDAEELSVIGGGELYALILPRATHLYLTCVDTEVEDAEAHFPKFDASEWKVTARESHPADAKHAFAYENVDYVRSVDARA